MYSYDDLILFTKIVKYKTFIKTSQVLNIAQSTISRRMKLLEDSLGLKLFFQDGRKIAFTDIGMILYSKIEKQFITLIELDELISNLKTNNKQISGTLKIVLPTTLAEYCITPYLSKFLTQYPDINLHIINRTAQIDLIHENIDIAILNHIPTQLDQKYLRIYSDVLQLYCTKEYIAQYGAPKTPQDLKFHLCVGAISSNDVINEEIDFINKYTDEVELVEMPKRIAVNSSTMSMTLLESDKMIVGLYEFMVRNKPNLIQVLPDYVVSNKFNHFYLVTHPHKDSIIIKAFVNFIKDIFLKQRAVPVQAKNEIVA